MPDEEECGDYDTGQANHDDKGQKAYLQDRGYRHQNNITFTVNLLKFATKMMLNNNFLPEGWFEFSSTFGLIVTNFQGQEFCKIL